MSIIEIMIVLAVIGLMMLVGYKAVQSASKSNLREDTVQVMATLRTAYSKAAQTGIHHRVVFDLEKQTYWIEACQGPMAIRRSEEEELPDKEALTELMDRQQAGDTTAEVASAESPEKAFEAAAALAGVRIGGARCEPIGAEIPGETMDRGNEGRIRTEKGLLIRRIHVQHLEDPVKDALVSINFFPLGYAEKAVIEVADKDSEVYTLLVHGLTGRVEFRSGELRDPNDHMRRDGAGNEVDER